MIDCGYAMLFRELSLRLFFSLQRPSSNTVIFRAGPMHEANRKKKPQVVKEVVANLYPLM